MKKYVIFVTAVAIALVAGIVIGFYWTDQPQVQSSGAIADTPMQRAGPFRLRVNVDPQPPAVGENSVLIEITDLNGTPVNDAQVNLVATMQAMGAMPEMRAPATINETAPGRYEGLFTLPMDGSWPLTLQISKENLGQTTLRFELATRRIGLQFVSGDQQISQGPASVELPVGTITLDARRRQAIGLKTAEARRLPMQRRVRAVGSVTYDETRLTDVTLRFDAWIGNLNADYVGAPVEEGETLFTVYGPDLLAAQQEYLEVKRRLGTGPLVNAALRRLQLWDMTDTEIATLDRRGTPLDYVPIAAPRSGTVVTKNIVEGTAHRAGMTLLRIADLSHVWVEAQVYEADLGIVTLGMTAMVTLPYLPAQSFEGTVDYVYPFLDGESRTTRIRVELDNADRLLKPDMYADVTLDANLGERLVVPVEAVIFAGERRVVFEDLGDGLLAPRYIQTGFTTGDQIEVIDGLEVGARVVTSGTFLIASESRLQSGLDQW